MRCRVVYLVNGTTVEAMLMTVRRSRQVASRGLAAGVAIAVLAGCASTPEAAAPVRTVAGGHMMTSGAPPEMPGTGVDARVGLTSNGGTVLVTVGRRLIVTLAAGWTAPRAAATVTGVTAPLTTMSAVGFPSPGVASATFRAVRTGEATVTAELGSACLQGMPRCVPAEQEFTMTVRVLPLAGAG
jgi:hypothetical protein